MKRLLLSLVLISGICTIVLAQPKRGGRGMKDLNLTSEQSEKIKALKGEQRKEMSALTKKYDDAIKSLLTADQAKIYEESKVMRKGPKDIVEKMEALEKEYQKEKTAIELSRIAPEMQQRKLKDLDVKYDAKRAKLRKEIGKPTPSMQAINPIAPIVMFDDVTKQRLEGVDENYNRAKKAIEMTRIAPEMQKMRIAELDAEVTGQRDIIIAADPNVIASTSADFLKKVTLDNDTRDKLQKLNESYLQKRKAIEMSRITKEMQDLRIKELNETTSAERETLVKSVGAAVNPLSLQTVKFDEITQNKLEAIGLEYQKTKKTVEMTRIAPEMQKMKIEALDKATAILREKVIAADPNLIASGTKAPGCDITLDKKAIAKLDGLNKAFEKAKGTILKTRIAPEMQTQKIKELQSEYADKRMDVVEAFLK